MLQPPLTIAPNAAFWNAAARALIDALPTLTPVDGRSMSPADLSGLRVVVPTHAHAHCLREALHEAIGSVFLPPRICTMGSWLALQIPDSDASAGLVQRSAGAERLMMLYAELRQHAWLKKLFAARRNTDLLPLAQTLLALSDELTAALLPGMEAGAGLASLDERWDAALAQLPPSARSVLSQEAQLVWSIWKSQLDADDPGAALLMQLKALAANAAMPLVWIAPAAPEPIMQAFLGAWSERQPVLPILPDWRPEALAWPLCMAWPEVLDTVSPVLPPGVEAFPDESASHARMPGHPARVPVSGISDDVHPCARTFADIALIPASSLEEEAQSGAQTVVDWLKQGKTTIAIVAQDRVVARRIRALLQRAEVHVADETGWKLSTTRAAAALAGWFEVVTSRGGSTALLDFLKSPFLVAGLDEHAEHVMSIEHALRRANIAGGWRTMSAAVPAGPARDYVLLLAAQAAAFRDRHTISRWLELTNAALEAFGVGAAYAADAAGQQMLAMLEAIGRDCSMLEQEFSFAEWRAYVSLQMEETAFVPSLTDWRVMMLPLSGTHLRSFDAVLVVGADATHLPSSASETLFFANAVRRELGLATRESKQLQQLRNFTELVSANSTVVLSWQAHRNGEPNPVSSWVARLALTLARSGSGALQRHPAMLSPVALVPVVTFMPAPAAPDMLPKKLSASGYGTLVACPYQFFATRMLGLAELEEFNERPEKRDYGDWLHQILHLFHTGLRDHADAILDRGAFLQQTTQEVFDVELAKGGAALGFHDRWQKAMPAYLAWAEAREAQGWQFVSGEEWRQQLLRWEGGEILLHGRIDRIDQSHAGEVAVLDYKTSSSASLKKRMEGSEDHQLAFYGLLNDVAPVYAAFVGLEPHKGKIDDISAPDYAARQQQLREQIGNVMQSIAAGAGLRASGIESVCQYCGVRGMCRKGTW